VSAAIGKTASEIQRRFPSWMLRAMQSPQVGNVDHCTADNSGNARVTETYRE